VKIRYKYEDNRGFPSGVVLYNKFRAEVSAAYNSCKFHKVREFIGCRNDVFPESARDVFQVPTLAVCPNQPPTKYVQGTSPWVNQPGRTAGR